MVTAAVTAPSIHIVLAHYNENATSMASLLSAILLSPAVAPMSPVGVHVLTKATDPTSLIADASLEPFGIVWTHLTENVGKEAESYLQYIVRQYQLLPDYVLFSQAAPHGRNVLLKRLMQFSSGVHMMGLGIIYGQDQGGCGCDGCEGHTEGHPLFGQLYALAARRLCPMVGID